ncbi:MAG TPA: hypothetical protein PLD47_11605 [Aggregatilineales bacterium]|nr:hypothetical protein [Anaerolineales bacterium]HRE48360.1 hypothetical protein [Aggregatilineales bacterium]
MTALRCVFLADSKRAILTRRPPPPPASETPMITGLLSMNWTWKNGKVAR